MWNNQYYHCTYIDPTAYICKRYLVTIDYEIKYITAVQGKLTEEISLDAWVGRGFVLHVIITVLLCTTLKCSKKKENSKQIKGRYISTGLRCITDKTDGGLHPGKIMQIVYVLLLLLLFLLLFCYISYINFIRFKYFD